MLARETCETSGKGATSGTRRESNRSASRFSSPCLALHAPRSVALADFFSILLNQIRLRNSTAEVEV